MSAVVAFALVLLAGCGSDDASTEASEPTEEFGVEASGFVGTVEGTDAFVAVVLDDAGVLVYACDGEAGLFEWMTGSPPSTSGEFAGTSRSGASVEGELVDDGVTGTLVDADGFEYSFSAERAKGDAGLYRTFGEIEAATGVSVAWVKDNAGAVRGATRRRAAPTSSTTEFIGRRRPTSSTTEFIGRRRPTSSTTEFIGRRRPISSTTAPESTTTTTAPESTTTTTAPERTTTQASVSEGAGGTTTTTDVTEFVVEPAPELADEVVIDGVTFPVLLIAASTAD